MTENEQIQEMEMEAIMLANDIWDLEHSRSVKDNFWLAKELQRKGYRKVERGEWINQADGTHYCSVCGHDATYTYDGTEVCGGSCPFCGADMRGEDDGKIH